MRSVHSHTYQRAIQELREARISAGITQEQVAARLRRPQSFVAKVERGERRIDVAEFIDLARAVDAEPLKLFRRLLTSS
jgi:transcriptional regulator with XRE-family HTH domain